jgi:hypothetical protein
MGQNRGKSVDDCLIEIDANQAFMRHLDPVADRATITRLRKQNTALGNRVQKLNSEARND